jgi:hypothetical protein
MPGPFLPFEALSLAAKTLGAACRNIMLHGGEGGYGYADSLPAGAISAPGLRGCQKVPSGKFLPSDAVRNCESPVRVKG